MISDIHGTINTTNTKESQRKKMREAERTKCRFSLEEKVEKKNTIFMFSIHN